MSRFKNRLTGDVAKGRRVSSIPMSVPRKAEMAFDIILAAASPADARFAASGNRLAKEASSAPPRFCAQVEAQWWITFLWDRSGAYDIELEDRGRRRG